MPEPGFNPGIGDQNSTGRIWTVPNERVIGSASIQDELVSRRPVTAETRIPGHFGKIHHKGSVDALPEAVNVV
jgi:hypothetical protein